MNSPGKEAIRFACSTSNEVPFGSKVKVRITLENINHPLYGTTNKLTCDVPLFIPFGKYPCSNYYSLDYEEQEKILDVFVRKHRCLHEELDEEQLRNKFVGWLILSATVFPNFEVHSDIFEGVASICAGSFQIDDALDETCAEAGISLDLKSLYKKYSIWERIFAGEFEAWEEVGRAFPVGALSIGFYIEAFQKFEKAVPNFRQNIIPFERSVFKGVEAIHLTQASRNSGSTGQVLESTGSTGQVFSSTCTGTETFSEEAMRKIREADAGGQLFVEAATALSNVALPSHVRQSLVFKIFINSYNLATGLLNDIFGLEKDLRNCDMNNAVLRGVQKHGLSLNDSFEQVSQLLNNCTRDMRFTSKILTKTFDLESVSNFIAIALQTFDGQVYAYFMLKLLGNRYSEASPPTSHSLISTLSFHQLHH